MNPAALNREARSGGQEDGLCLDAEHRRTGQGASLKELPGGGVVCWPRLEEIRGFPMPCVATMKTGLVRQEAEAKQTVSTRVERIMFLRII